MPVGVGGGGCALKGAKLELSLWLEVPFPPLQPNGSPYSSYATQQI